MKRHASMLRYLALVSMLLMTMASAVSPAAAGPGAPAADGLGMFQEPITVALCQGYDVDDDLTVSETEAEALTEDVTGDGQVTEADYAKLVADCSGLTSQPPQNDQVCPEEGKVEPGGEQTSIEYTAPEGFLIEGYCVKAGSIQQGDGPEYVYFDTPVASVTIEHSSGKAISHYTVFLVPDEVEEPGFVKVVKYFCEGADLEGPTVMTAAFDSDDCETGIATFQILDSDDLPLPLDYTKLLDTGYYLPAGEYTLVELVEGEVVLSYPFTLEVGEEEIIVVVNPVEVPDNEDVTLSLYKFVCSGFSKMHEDGCVEDYQLDETVIDFSVSYTIGEETTTVDTSLEIEGSEGSFVLTLPLADSYTVCEDVPDGVEEVLFSVGEVDDVAIDENGCITFSGDGFSGGDVINVAFWNDMEDEKPVTPEKPEEPKTPEKPVTPAKPIVTKLPSTGSGAADTGTNAPIMLIAAAATMATAAVILRKERMAA